MYEYALSRSLKKNGAPPGYVNHRRPKNPFSWRYRHGVVQYNRPVSEDDMVDHNLEPLTQSDPRFMEAIYHLVYDDVMTQLVNNSRYVTVIDGNKTAVIERDFDVRPHKMGLQVYDRSGNPVGKIIHARDVGTIVPSLWKMFTDKRKKTYLSVVAKNV